VIGKTLSHYRIDSKLGEGGMGEVYRAHDERLDREVAIKVLPEEVAKDEARLARFEREAKLLASLSHQNIATLYGLETVQLPATVIPSEERSDGARDLGGGMEPGRSPHPDPSTRESADADSLAQDDINEVGVSAVGTRTVHFLVMELVQGEDLATRIKRGPIQVDDALDYARQIAEGLEAAHEQDIIHRDLKPANVMLSPEGKVKVLDFGLAKAWQPEESDAELTHSPTLTAQMTAAGVLLGTAAYMSPEQARGRPVDKRADIWAFGVVLWEMLTGNRMHLGETVSDTLASVLTSDPDASELPPDTPWRVRDLLRRCLIKDPKERLRDIGDGRIELVAAIAGPTDSAFSEPLERDRHRIGFLLPATALVALAMGVAVGWILIGPGASVPSVHPQVSRFSLTLPEEAVYLHDDWPLLSLAISPDGSRIAYRGEDRRSSYGVGQLYLRSLDDVEVRPIPLTENACQPFFSPDGQWLAFFNKSGELKKVSLEGGRPMTVAREIIGSQWSFGSWGDDGNIVYSVWGLGLFVVHSDGGQQRVLTSPREAELHDDPVVLPGSRAVLFAASTADTEEVKVLTLDNGETHTVLENAGDPRYLASGHLLVTREKGLMVAPFDIDRLEISGPPVPAPLSVRFDSVAWGSSTAQLAVSHGGTLVYAPGGESFLQRSTFSWVDRQGRVQETMTVPVSRPLFQLSPTGTRAIVTDMHGGSTRYQILDLERGTLDLVAQFRQLEMKAALWSSDQSIIFPVADADGSHLMEQTSSGSPPADILDAPGIRYLTAGDVSSNGRMVVYMATVAGTAVNTLRLFDRGQEVSKGNPISIEQTTNHVWPGAFSPDGQWLAYVSNEAALENVYVRRLPDGVPKQIVSKGYGECPMWSPDGREIFYLQEGVYDAESRMWGYGIRLMAVSVEFTPQLRLGEPRQLFEGLYHLCWDGGASSYGVSPDGSRFLMVGPDEDPESTRELMVVLNWFEELNRLVPTE
jgi:serine/threonine-protein kinase